MSSNAVNDSVNGVSNIYAMRHEKIFKWMAEEGISLIMLEDSEWRRDQNIRWLTGHPGDALLFLALNVSDDSPSSGQAVLVAWDLNLAKICASDAPVFIGSYNDFGRQPVKAAAAVAKTLKIPYGSKIEIPAVTPYPSFLEFVGELTDYDILCREKGAATELNKWRAVKDAEEIAIIRQAAGITNKLIDLLEENVRSGKIKTEADAALFIEVEARNRGCEGTSFGILAAGPHRSFAIHAFPGWTCAPFGGQGLSILDFGVNYKGYCTDVTLTFARDLNPKQEKLVALVEKAAKLALPMARNGTPARDIAAAVDAHFSKSKKQMPHSLGHGIGLQAHEYPLIRNRNDNEWVLEQGMIFTIEPGLYDIQLGGCRLENDILITESAPEVLTTARIIRL
ncbi:MAG: Xaa-Pro peptidase family protein [Treponema sp.]|jgi:Xaa-Pro dipeptidase|nr:Xaa-Pro peptidase family protein [Treponema sp.]